MTTAAPKVQRGRPPKKPTMIQTEMTMTTESTTSENKSDQTENTGFSVKERKSRGPNRGKDDEALALIAGSLTLALEGVSGLVSVVNPIDGMCIKVGSDRLVSSIVALAKQDKNVRLYLLKLATQSAYMNVIGSVMVIIIPILANHNLLPPIFAAPVSPVVNGNGVNPFGG